MMTALGNHVGSRCCAVVGLCGARRKFGLRKFRVNSTISPESGHIVLSIRMLGALLVRACYIHNLRKKQCGCFIS
jgi:hypothetical protein